MQERSTIHRLALDAVVAIVLSKEEFEVLSWVFDVANFIFIIDEVSVDS